jgi:4-amino-4-deoxy-L-arabinose transferase-like glycosyltransferase
MLKIFNFCKNSSGNLEISPKMAFIVVLAIWAAVYLPSLSVSPIDINEARRIYPAITMLETGDWKTPVLAGIEYYTKPPLMNWMLASSFYISGEETNLFARLPTTLNVLLLALIVLLVPRKLMSLNTRLISSVFVLTTVGTIGSCRTANIDPNYMCFTGMAVVFWLNAWAQDKYGFSMWLPASIFVGLGALAKGPLILLFYYAMVVSVLIYEKKARKLLSFPHFLSIALIFGIFGAWAYSASAGRPADPDEPKMASTWIKEMAYRFKLHEIKISTWFGRIMDGIAQFMPWGLLIILAFWKSILKKLELTEKQKILVRSSRWALLVPFIAICLLPLTKGRYNLPLLTLLVLVSALMLSKLEIPKLVQKILKPLLFYLSFACAILSAVLLACRLFGVFTLISEKWGLSENFLGNAGEISITLAICTVIAAGILFAFSREVDEACSDSTAIALKIAGLITVGTMIFTVFILPMREREEDRCAGEIEGFFPEGSRIYCVGYVGREPYLFYVDRKKEMCEAVKYIEDKAVCFIIEQSRVDYLENHKDKFKLKEIGRQPMIYKGKHKYYLIQFGDKDERKSGK